MKQAMLLILLEEIIQVVLELLLIEKDIKVVLI